MLGYPTPLKYTYDPFKGLMIEFPYIPPPQLPSQYAWSLKLTNTKSLPPTIGLANYYNSTGEHYVLCGLPDCYGVNSGYQLSRYEGVAFENEEPGTLPLTLYYSAANNDFATVLNYNMSSSDYEFVSIQGYAFPTQVIN